MKSMQNRDIGAEHNSAGILNYKRITGMRDGWKIAETDGNSYEEWQI